MIAAILPPPPPPLRPPPPLSSLHARCAPALFLDFDGTLVPIASGPDAIEVPHDLADRLEVLANRLDGRLALISGRGLDDIEQHLGPIAVARAGSHGAHRLAANGDTLGNNPQPIHPDALRAVEELAAHHDALLEHKAHGAAIHYRTDPSRGPAIESAARAIAAAHDLCVKNGKCVIELVRPGAQKGDAVDAFMATAPFTGTMPVFIGDDVTDEDGFLAARRHGGFGIAVGERPSKNARYALASVKDVHEWLNL